MFLVLLKLEQIIMMITVIGTESTIPAIPQMAPQIVNDSITTSELILREFPISFGSKKFPTIICTAPTRSSTRMQGVNESSPNCSSAMSAGNNVPIKDPIEGIKLSVKIRKAKNKADSIPISKRII